jgi:hypothetical protein
VSGGFLHTDIGVNTDYLTDLRHELGSNAVGVGGRITLSERLSFDIAALNVWYAEADKQIAHPPLGSFTESYKRTSVSIAVG